MKSILTILTIVVTVGLAAQPQKGGHGKGKGAEIKALLNLTDEQAKEMRAIHQEYKPELQEIRNSGLSKTEKMEAFIILQEQVNYDVSGVLNEEQFSKYVAFKEEKIKQRIEKGNKLKKELDLTEEQAESLKSIKAKYKPEVQALKMNTELSREDKKAAYSEIRTTTDTEVQQVLSPEQYEKLQILKEERKAQKKAERQ